MTREEIDNKTRQLWDGKPSGHPMVWEWGWRDGNETAPVTREDLRQIQYRVQRWMNTTDAADYLAGFEEAYLARFPEGVQSKGSE